MSYITPTLSSSSARQSIFPASHPYPVIHGNHPPTAFGLSPFQVYHDRSSKTLFVEDASGSRAPMWVFTNNIIPDNITFAGTRAPDPRSANPGKYYLQMSVTGIRCWGPAVAPGYWPEYGIGPTWCLRSYSEAFHYINVNCAGSEPDSALVGNAFLPTLYIDTNCIGEDTPHEASTVDPLFTCAQLIALSYPASQMPDGHAPEALAEEVIPTAISAVPGPKGDSGTKGPQGPRGLSAYETWLTLPGNAGKSEATFITALKSPSIPGGAKGDHLAKNSASENDYGWTPPPSHVPPPTTIGEAASEANFVSGHFVEHVTITPEPGAHLVTVAFEALAASDGMFMWGINIEGVLTYLGDWDQLPTSGAYHQRSWTFKRTFTGTETVAITFKGTGTHPVKVRNATLAAIKTGD